MHHPTNHLPRKRAPRSLGCRRPRGKNQRLHGLLFVWIGGFVLPYLGELL